MSKYISGLDVKGDESFANYKLCSSEPILTNGGFGVVFKAVKDVSVFDERENKEYFAVKVPKLENGDPDEREIAEIRSEVTNWEMLSECPHVVKLEKYDDIYCDSGKRLIFFASEWSDVGSIEKLLRSGSFLSEKESVCYAFDMLCALNEAQSVAKKQGKDIFVHGDIKLDNVLLFIDDKTGEKYAKVTDFGSSRMFNGYAKRTAVPLTWPYADPDRVMNLEITMQSDLWAVNVALYIMLTGKYPFNDVDGFPKGEIGIKKAIIDGVFHEMSSDLSVELRKIIRKAFSVDVNRRFLNPDEYISALVGAFPGYFEHGRRKEYCKVNSWNKDDIVASIEDNDKQFKKYTDGVMIYDSTSNGHYIRENILYVIFFFILLLIFVLVYKYF